MKYKKNGELTISSKRIVLKKLTKIFSNAHLPIINTIFYHMCYHYNEITQFSDYTRIPDENREKMRVEFPELAHEIDKRCARRNSLYAWEMRTWRSRHTFLIKFAKQFK